MTIWIADISNHQGGISIEQIVAEGYSAVICKASEGATFRDGWFDRFIPQVKSAGAIPGAYHFLRAGDGAAQARILHGRVTDHGGPSGFVCACDNEADADWDTTVAFTRAWYELSGCHPLLMYTGGWWWRPRGWPGAELTPYLWHSHYVTGSGYGSDLYGQVTDAHWMPGYGGWSEATILQFSSFARVAGQSIDANAFRGSREQLLALTRTTSEGDRMSALDDAAPAVIHAADVIGAAALGRETTWDERPIEWMKTLRQLRDRPAVELTEDQLAAIGSAAAAQAAEIIGGRMAELERRVELLIGGRVAAAGAESDALAP